jgi:hypothetical protein
MNEKKHQINPKEVEDATQYGEFISSYFAWTPLSTQKEKAEEMNKMTCEQKRNITKCTQTKEKHYQMFVRRKDNDI